jgi:thiamine pyrophosphate-dependent acetolactate synthase large subunit-like protein
MMLLLGAMGLAPSVAAGLQMARPDIQVVCVEGDGNAAMSGEPPRVVDFARIILDNGIYETTGGQEVPPYAPVGAEVLCIAAGRSGAPRPPPPDVIIRRVLAWLA